MAAKKEIDDWLRAPSYIKSKGKNEDNHKPALDRDDDEFLTQLQRSSTRQNAADGVEAKALNPNHNFDADTISVSQFKF